MRYIILAWILDSGVLTAYAGKHPETKKDMYVEELAFAKQLNKGSAKEVYDKIPKSNKFYAAVIKWTEFNAQYPFGISMNWLKENNAFK